MTLQGLRIDSDVDATRDRAPFDPLTQVSADAKYIVRQMVLWFLLLPFLLSSLAYLIYLWTR